MMTEKKKKFVFTKDGNSLGHTKVESLEDARELSNAMYNSGHYPRVSKCFAAGINGDWENGVCPIYRIEKSECTCTDMHGEFEEIIAAETYEYAGELTKIIICYKRLSVSDTPEYLKIKIDGLTMDLYFQYGSRAGSGYEEEKWEYQASATFADVEAVKRSIKSKEEGGWLQREVLV